MAQLSDVTQAMLHRLDVDLLGDEISSCLRIFDVPLWRKAERRGDLQSACFKLCSILGLPHPRTVVAFVSSAAQALLPQLDAAATQHLHVPNKLAWTWALIPAWRAKHTAGRLGATRECEQLVAFYLACKINTTPLERNLGKLLEQLQAHSGPLADNGCTAAALIEVALDGPRREEELFTWARGAPGNPAASADTAGMAMPTHFARLCQKLWLAHFGRRFRHTYRVGSQRTPRQKGGRGGGGKSLAAIARARGQAARSLARDARRGQKPGSARISSFVPGLTLPLHGEQWALRGSRWSGGGSSSGSAQQAGSPLHAFTKHTDRKAERGLSNCLVSLFHCASTQSLRSLVALEPRTSTSFKKASSRIEPVCPRAAPHRRLFPGLREKHLSANSSRRGRQGVPAVSALHGLSSSEACSRLCHDRAHAPAHKRRCAGVRPTQRYGDCRERAFGAQLSLCSCLMQSNVLDAHYRGSQNDAPPGETNVAD